MATERSRGVSRTVLPGGLRVVTEFLPAVRSVALGIWVGVGSRDEDETHAGATHYLEHLLFKGTSRRTALEISAAMDAVGGEMNAFTAKEYTCYYARVLDADLPLAVDVLSDMVTSSLITPKDVDAERNVVLEEIAMNEDDPSDTVHEAFTAKLFGDTPLGRPILGTVDSINAITRDQIFEHYRARYTAEHLVGLGRQAADVDPPHAGVGVLGREAVHRVGQAALLPDLLEQPGGHPAAERRVQHAEREPAVIGPGQGFAAQDQVGLLDAARDQRGAHAGLRAEATHLALRTMSAFPGSTPILVDSAGCGAALKDYGHLLGTAEARCFAARVLDVHEWLADRVDRLPPSRERGTGREGRPLRIAVQDPCHLRHVQRCESAVRTVLERYGEIVELGDEGRCCGAGGAYSALQPELAGQIRTQKMAAIAAVGPDVVASANPGCGLWLAAAGVPVRHPLEIVAAEAGLDLPNGR